jgi:hypothetical protein
MAVISGILISKEQADALMQFIHDTLDLDNWPDGSVTLHNGDQVIVEFVVS